MAFHHTACFVFTVMIVCNAILYPSIFSNMYKQWFGGGESSGTGTERDDTQMYPPHMRHHGPRSPPNRGPMGGDRVAAQMAPQAQKEGAGKSRGMMSSVLPVYAVGIIVYFAYIMYRIFFKDQGQKDPITGQPIRGAPCINTTPTDNYAAAMDSRSRRVYEEELQRTLQKELKPDKYRERADKNLPQYVEEEGDDIVTLQKRLEETEKAMEKMMEYMNKMGVAMSQVTEQMATNESPKASVRPKRRRPQKVDDPYYDDHDMDRDYVDEYYDDEEDEYEEEVVVKRVPKKTTHARKRNVPVKYKADVPRSRRSRGPPKRKVVYVEEVEDDSDVDEDIYANDMEDENEEIVDEKKICKEEKLVVDNDQGAHDDLNDNYNDTLIPENGIEDDDMCKKVRKRKVKEEED
ncbi:uncharacterized protein LOC102800680 [Saccoglossus kowalevskii]|uniref:DNA mismatch repair protein Msh3-like n=1 Tax=Saccoglossus kowalevskii TaxID=10224 RepID=A0ABM0LX39_SACKO|nr:PREDICTED: DNA mismatch repair protein Msh3-like [Saccoglossus kowalevskii]